MAQEQKKDENTIPCKQVVEMNIEELSAYDPEEIMKLMNIIETSTIEELYRIKFKMLLLIHFVPRVA